MTPEQIITLYLTGRNGERDVQIWTNTSGLALPPLHPEDRYRLTAYNGPRMLYACTPATAEFVLQRLYVLLDHTPSVSFVRCLKCQCEIARAMAYQDERYPMNQRIGKAQAEHAYRTTEQKPLTDVLGQQQEPDPVIRELEELNLGLQREAQESIPAFITKEYKKWAHLPFGDVAGHERMLKRLEQQKAAASARLVELIGQDEADRLLAMTEPVIKAKAELDALTQKRIDIRLPLPEPDRTTPALDVAHDPTRPVALTREEIRALDDLVFKNCEDWTELLQAKHYLQLRALGMFVERAESIIRKTGNGI